MSWNGSLTRQRASVQTIHAYLPVSILVLGNKSASTLCMIVRSDLMGICRVPDCPNIATLDQSLKIVLRVAQHNGDTVSLHQIMGLGSCCLCKTSLHK